MARSRLTAALGEGSFPLPEGEIVVLRPPAEADLSALPMDRTTIVHGFRPDRDAWEGAGWRVADDAGPAAAALVCVPRSKALARGLVAEAAGLAPLVLVDGQRGDGVDALWRDVRGRREVEGIAQAHGRLFWFPGGPGFEDWALPGPERGADGLWSQAGVFSADGPDEGSRLLAEALPAKLPTRMADFGAGIGVLSLAVLAREGVASLDLIEAERLAVDCARRNLADPRARILWEDATQGRRGPYDGIVTNPPFHQGRAAEPELGRRFLAAAAAALTPSGRLWVVANRRLPYETALRTLFREVAEIGGTGAFKLLLASHPVTARDRARAGAARRPRR